MTSEAAKRGPLPTIWRVPDELWAEVEPIVAEVDRPNRAGPKRTPGRPVPDAIIWRGRAGCRWNRPPKGCPDDGTVHRLCRRWREAGVVRRGWAVLIERCAALDGVAWECQAAGGAPGTTRKDVLSRPFRRGESQIGVMDDRRAGEPEGSRTLVLSGRGGKLRREGRASRRPEGCRLVVLLGRGASWRRPSCRGRATGPGAIALMDLLVVALAGRQQVVQDLQPAVGEGADCLEGALAGGVLLVVEGADPAGAPIRAPLRRVPLSAGDATGPNPTDRGKPGSKRHLVVDRDDIPLTVYLTAANVNDGTFFEELLESIEPIKRPGPVRPRVRTCNLHDDKAYECQHCRAYLRRRGILSRIARKGIESSAKLERHR